jgi:hypothetical protein
MIIDPLSFVPLETDRRLTEARLARAARAPAAGPRRRRRRGLVLRVAAWATGRAVHA